MRKKNQFRDFYTISGFYAETWCRLVEPEPRKFTLLFVAKNYAVQADGSACVKLLQSLFFIFYFYRLKVQHWALLKDIDYVAVTLIYSVIYFSS